MVCKVGRKTKNTCNFVQCFEKGGFKCIIVKGLLGVALAKEIYLNMNNSIVSSICSGHFFLFLGVLISPSKWVQMHWSGERASLTLTHANKEDEGLYTLRVTMGDYYEEYSAYVFVKGKMYHINAKDNDASGVNDSGISVLFCNRHNSYDYDL